MQITIVNNSLSDVAAPGEVTVAAGGTVTQTGRTIAEYQALVTGYAGSTVQVHGQLENGDLPPLALTMKTPADPAADATTLAACGFDILDVYGSAFSTTENMYLAAFDNATCTTKSTTATLDTAATGTIVSGAATNTLLITPVGGVVSVTLTIAAAADQIVYLKAWPATFTRPMGSNGVHTATFSKT
jgi:hypothetical protein